MLIATANNNVCHLLINKEGFDLIKKAAINANPICDKALRTITIGKPASRNPSPVPKATNIATGTDIKILKNKGTWHRTDRRRTENYFAVSRNHYECGGRAPYLWDADCSLKHSKPKRH